MAPIDYQALNCETLDENRSANEAFTLLATTLRDGLIDRMVANDESFDSIPYLTFQKLISKKDY